VAFSYTIGDCALAGLSNLSKADQVKVYPNPAHNKITLVLPDGVTHYSVQILNALGQVVTVSAFSEIDVSDLSNGIYTVCITAENFSVNKKLVIAK
jgi:hypothetical protein